MSVQSVETSVDQELQTAADDGSALLAVVGLERVLGSALKITKGDAARAGSLARDVSRRCVSFLDQKGFKPIRLGMNKIEFLTLRDLVLGMDETKLAAQVGAIADVDLKVSFGAVVQVALSFLQGRIPKTPIRLKSTSPGDFQAASFVRAWRTISDPLTVIGDLEMGCLSVDQVKTLQAVYPVLYELFANAMVAAVIERSVDSDYITPYPKLKQISVLLQQPLVSEDLKGVLTAAFSSPDADKPMTSGGSSPDVGLQSATQLQKSEFGMK